MKTCIILFCILSVLVSFMAAQGDTFTSNIINNNENTSTDKNSGGDNSMSVTITSPSYGIQLFVGQLFNVTWTLGAVSDQSTVVNLQLLKGEKNNSRVISEIGQGILVTLKRYVWPLNDNSLANASDYVVRLYGQNLNTYSKTFTITNLQPSTSSFGSNDNIVSKYGPSPTITNSVPDLYATGVKIHIPSGLIFFGAFIFCALIL